MTAPINITGQRFGKLVAVRPAGRTASGGKLWLCKCDCGGETRATAGLLRAGRHRACSCGRSQPRHGMHDTRLYRVWDSMKARCLRASHVRYARYGGRGISITDEWLDFPTFASWARSNGYRSDLQIDRIDNNGNYEPGNCRFVTPAVNMANRG